ncbi:hypothetical protein DPM19_30620 [Actinomadura craniellae]|uniref:NodB homology domain-containing protein n=1 Tax=Actinomadura craniellae TaxID=2231787 RepID=A0A365GX24_9ACTN|nr:hypothetical protein [Actinomadura craniellae]RAY11381.1 hypothetical protein DPM19_30620 [Actinomadura craniellae]
MTDRRALTFSGALAAAGLVTAALPAAPAHGRAAADAAITAPTGQDTLHRTGALAFHGTASGAASVRVAVQDRLTRLWWRGDGTWGDQQRHPAALAGTAWSYTWTPPAGGDYLVQVFAADPAGATDPTPPFARFTALDLPARERPAAALAQPAQDQPVPAGTPLTARGLAADDMGVREVQIAVQDRGTGRWWHADGSWGGQQWQQAALAAPGTALTGWSYTWTPPADGDYAFQVRARDTAGQTDPDLPYRRFAGDGADPAVQIAGEPGRTHPAGRAVTWTGTATDTRGVAEVWAAVQDRTTGRWWHADGSWGEYVRHPAAPTGPVPGATTAVTGDRRTFTGTGWTFSWTPPGPGDFALRVTAVDGAGRSVTNPPQLGFAASPAPADTTAPQAAFTAPRAGQAVLGSPVRIAGTAADDVAVTAVYVGIMDRATGRWWRPGEGWGAYRRIVPATVRPGTRSVEWSYDWTPPAPGGYLVHVEALDAAGNVASAPGGGRPNVRFDHRPDGTGYTTLLLSRSQWGVVDHACRPVPGAVPLDEVARELTARGVRATGTIVVNRALEAGRHCTPNFTDYAGWAELAGLQAAHGWRFVSHGATYANMTALTPAEQRTESCGSLTALAARGHTRAWGLFNYPNDQLTEAIQRDVVATCFAFGRRYGTGGNRSAAPPYFQSTWSWPSGHCNDPTLTCYHWAPGLTAVPRRYTSPEELAARLSGGAGDWQVAQGYKFLRGRRISASGQQWDCTGADWRSHWTNSAESYCLTDLLAAVSLARGAVYTDPATVAEAWGRPRP